MSNGRIIYIPIPTQALELDGLHFLSLAETAFNFGTQTFAVDVLFMVDPTVADPTVWLASKAPADLAGNCGWVFYYTSGTRKLGLIINDGNASALTVQTADNVLPEHGNRVWARMEVDRAGQARFKVGAGSSWADVGGGLITARPGSLDNDEPLRIGALSATEYRHKGAIDFVRFDLARLLPAAWHQREWDKMRYGLPQDQADFPARWNFKGNLIDSSVNLFTLSWEGGGAPVYAAGWPATVDYTFQRDYDRFNDGPETGYLDAVDRQRTVNLASFSYGPPALKKRFSLNFPLLNHSQLTALLAAEAGQQPFAFYEAADEPPSCQAKFAEGLRPKLLMEGWWSLRAEVEET